VVRNDRATNRVSLSRRACASSVEIAVVETFTRYPRTVDAEASGGGASEAIKSGTSPGGKNDSRE
jgi:hypothetical protein